jgi:hypothetical protein
MNIMGDEPQYQNPHPLYPWPIAHHVRHGIPKGGRDRCRVLYLLPPGKNSGSLPVLGRVETLGGLIFRMSLIEIKEEARKLRELNRLKKENR